MYSGSTVPLAGADARSPKKRLPQTVIVRASPGRPALSFWITEPALSSPSFHFVFRNVLTSSVRSAPIVSSAALTSLKCCFCRSSAVAGNGFPLSFSTASRSASSFPAAWGANVNPPRFSAPGGRSVGLAAVLLPNSCSKNLFDISPVASLTLYAPWSRAPACSWLLTSLQVYVASSDW